MKDSLLLGAPAARGRALAGHELIRTSDPCTNLIPGVHKSIVVCVTSELEDEQAARSCSCYRYLNASMEEDVTP